MIVTHECLLLELCSPIIIIPIWLYNFIRLKWSSFVSYQRSIHSSLFWIVINSFNIYKRRIVCTLLFLKFVLSSDTVRLNRTGSKSIIAMSFSFKYASRLHPLSVSQSVSYPASQPASQLVFYKRSHRTRIRWYKQQQMIIVYCLK